MRFGCIARNLMRRYSGLGGRTPFCAVNILELSGMWLERYYRIWRCPMHDCSRLGRVVYLLVLFIAAGVFGCATTQSAAPTGPSAQAAAQAEKTVAPGQVQRPVYQGPLMAPYYPPPGIFYASIRIGFLCNSPLDNQGWQRTC